MVVGVVLAGGRARRLGGRHKPAIALPGGPTLLERALDALAGADRVVVVGPSLPVHTANPPIWTREDPPGGGPVAALAAGLAALGPVPPDTEIVALAADLPGVTADTVRRLRAALATTPGVVGAVLRDATGRRQWLISVWRAGALAGALPLDPTDHPLRATLNTLPAAEVPERAGESADIDTQADLDRLMGGRIRDGPSQPSH